jgi:hypothetical protein
LPLNIILFSRKDTNGVFRSCNLKDSQYMANNGAMGCECSVLVVIITISSLEIFSVFEDKHI